jgi:hypothetical protein
MWTDEQTGHDEVNRQIFKSFLREHAKHKVYVSGSRLFRLSVS